VKISVDAATGSALMGKLIEAVKALLEEIASNNYNWSTERATPKRSCGKYEVDTMTLLANRVDALAQTLDRVSTPLLIGMYAICETCGVQENTSVECYNGSSTVRHANARHSFNHPSQNNSHSTTYNQSWKNHLNPLYKNSNPYPQSSLQSPEFQYRAPYNPSPSPPHYASNLESLMECFIETQTKTNEALGESIDKLSSKFKAITSYQKAMHSYIPQIAQQVSHLSWPKGHLLGHVETNPRGHINALSIVGKGLEEALSWSSRR